MKILTTQDIRRLISEGNERKVYKSRYWTDHIRPAILKEITMNVSGVNQKENLIMEM